MKNNGILKKAADKANAAKTLLEGATPDMAQATGLLDEAKALREQAEKTCVYCGQSIGRDNLVCGCCSAPTPAWRNMLKTKPR